MTLEDLFLYFLMALRLFTYAVTHPEIVRENFRDTKRWLER